MGITTASISSSITLLTLTLFSFSHPSPAAASHISDRRTLPPAVNVVVEGTVLCDACFGGEPSKAASSHIAGALVSVQCGAAPEFRREARTDRHGVFRVRLPHIGNIKACSVKLISSNGNTSCTGSSSATSTSLQLKREKKKSGRLQVYSAGFSTFRPLQQPDFCYQNVHLLPTPTVGGVPIPPNPVLPRTSLLAIPKLLPPIPTLPLIPGTPPSATSKDAAAP